MDDQTRYILTAKHYASKSTPCSDEKHLSEIFIPASVPPLSLSTRAKRDMNKTEDLECIISHQNYGAEHGKSPADVQIHTDKYGLSNKQLGAILSLF